MASVHVVDTSVFTEIGLFRACPELATATTSLPTDIDMLRTDMLPNELCCSDCQRGPDVVFTIPCVPPGDRAGKTGAGPGPCETDSSSIMRRACNDFTSCSSITRRECIDGGVWATMSVIGAGHVLVEAGLLFVSSIGGRTDAENRGSIRRGGVTGAP